MLKRMCPPPCAPLLRADERQVHRVGDEVGLQQQPLLLALVGEVVGLAGEAALEVVRGVEDEELVLVEVHHRRRVGDGDEARRLAARAVEVLVGGVERDREQRPRPPLEGDAGAGVVPDGGGAAPVQHQDHLLEQLPLGLELTPRRDLAHVAIVGGARGVVVDEHGRAAPPHPGLELHGAEVAHVEGADDVQALLLHPTGVGRLLLGGELARQFFGHDGVLGHFRLLADVQQSDAVPPASSS